MEISYQDRARGALVGLAVGDALGAPVEFLPEPSDVYIEEMGDTIEHFHKNYRAPEGVWTDDTEQALCLADSLLVNGGYDSYDIMRRLTAWADEGYRTYDGQPATDVGGQTMRAIRDFERHPVVLTDEETESAGNGPIMRLAPIALAVKDTESMVKMAMLSCKETHNSITAITATAVFATALSYALHGEHKNSIIVGLSDFIRDNDDYFLTFGRNEEQIRGRALHGDGAQLHNLGGYIVDTLAIALWGLMHFDNFKDGMMAVIRLGGDTDTNAACYGQLAGAYYGYGAIPEEWRSEVYLADELVKVADDLAAIPQCPIIRTRFEGDEDFEDIAER